MRLADVPIFDHLVLRKTGHSASRHICTRPGGVAMARALDVAAYILERSGPGPLTAMKLQKLVYYSQAWSLVWDERPLFPERIEAWANGPVCPTLYNFHRGSFHVSRMMIGGDPDSLSADERETVDAVLDYYGKMNSQYLSDLTHAEQPWQIARGQMSPGERGNSEITHASMAEFYGSLPPDA
jgi:uncharacterized phage-associated protein